MYYSTCFCPVGFYGRRCQFEDLCAQADYCSHHGECIRQENSASCECYEGFTGDRCQTSESYSCSFHTFNETGVLEFQPPINLVTEYNKTKMVSFFNSLFEFEIKCQKKLEILENQF